MPCMQGIIDNFNDAIHHAAEQSGECSICCDTLGASKVGVSAKLAMTTLPGCNHRFHEICIMQWLSPIKLPPTDHAPTAGSTSKPDSIVRASAEATNTTDSDDDLPQQIASEATQNLVRGIAGMMQHMIDGLEADERRGSTNDDMQAIEDDTEEYNRPDRVVQRARTIASMLASRAEDQFRDVIREINERGLEILDDDLEEGEIREQPSILFPNLGDADSQALAPIDIFNNTLPNPNGVSRHNPSAARSHHCPLCRRLPFGQEVLCHVDTLQLLRVRLRLTDLAYACFHFQRRPEETKDRAGTVYFLHRRHADNEALGEHEILPFPQECRKIFKHARHTLRIEAYRYMQRHRLSAAEQLRVVQLITLFENFELQDEQIAFFFDPHPYYDTREWSCEFSAEEIQSMYENPKEFFKKMEILPMIEGSHPQFPIELNGK
ncbi:MAG: hypothetical protein Q9225_003034 [Loekoesia sp. 1 TL-2023]